MTSNISYTSSNAFYYGLTASPDFSSFIATKLQSTINNQLSNLLISKNGGVNWTNILTAGSKSWRGVTANTDFTRIVATSTTGIFWSSDSAGSWTSMGSSLSNKDWTGICSSEGESESRSRSGIDEGGVKGLRVSLSFALYWWCLVVCGVVY